jgi:hypothetical protein
VPDTTNATTVTAQRDRHGGTLPACDPGRIGGWPQWLPRAASNPANSLFPTFREKVLSSLTSRPGPTKTVIPRRQLRASRQRGTQLSLLKSAQDIEGK